MEEAMPPKIKITKEEIIETSLGLVRTGGLEAVNARAVAAVLNCSTQPVFSNFATMEELHIATLTAAYGVYADFIKREVESGKYPPYKAFGMAYIRFAKEEKELFRLLFMRERSVDGGEPSTDYNESVEMIMKSNGVSRERAELMHLEMWACVHGIGTMFVTSYLSLDWELVSRMLSDVYQGIRVRHIEEEKRSERN